MRKITVYYLKTNIFRSPFSIENGDNVSFENRKNGEIIPFNIEKQYQGVVSSVFPDQVDTTQGNAPYAIGTSDESLLEYIFYLFNHDGARMVSNAIINGKIEDVSHSSMSIGDVIEINNEYFIIGNIGFYKVSLN